MREKPTQAWRPSPVGRTPRAVVVRLAQGVEVERGPASRREIEADDAPVDGGEEELPTHHVAVVDPLLAPDVERRPAVHAVHGHGVALVEAGDPGAPVEEEDEVGVRAVGLGGGHLAVVDVGREAVPRRAAEHAHQPDQLPLGGELGHRVEAGDGHEQPAVGSRGDVVEVVEAGERDHPADLEARQIADQHLGLRAQVRGVPFEGGGLEDERRGVVVRAVLGRSLVLEHPPRPAVADLDHHPLPVLGPLLGLRELDPLLPPHHPERLRHFTFRNSALSRTSVRARIHCAGRV
jgi:hypothetical protein